MKSGRLIVWCIGCMSVGVVLAANAPRGGANVARQEIVLATAPAPSDADYAAHVARIKKDLPGFTVIIQKPFVVAGDGTEASVRNAATGTVKWTIDHLKKDYFDKDPTDLITVYLFKDEASYDKHTKEYFHDTPTTPFGYYSPTHKALIMNISTGGGTLVHEIVHPYMAANFPACPTWFNEGLASLYEQSMEKDGHIWGLPNWRLAGLKEALAGKGDPAPAFKDLCAMDASTFYGAGKGPAYATARYLCLYLQEKGVLRQFYKDFVNNQKVDPTGYDTLQKTLAGLGEKNMEAFRKKWEMWVLLICRRFVPPVVLWLICRFETGDFCFKCPDAVFQFMMANSFHISIASRDGFLCMAPVSIDGPAAISPSPPPPRFAAAPSWFPRASWG